MRQTIVLVRHGPSAHVLREWVDHAGFLRWRRDYEAAGIGSDHAPAEVQAMAAGSAVIVASDARRAIESAKRLAPDRDVSTTPLLAELELEPIRIPWVRMPLLMWAITYGIRWLRHRTIVSPHERPRVEDAAGFLTGLALREGSVFAVTHGSFRSEVAARLEQRGWRCETATRRNAHWSAWVFSRE